MIKAFRIRVGSQKNFVEIERSKDNDQYIIKTQRGNKTQAATLFKNELRSLCEIGLVVAK